MDVDTKTVLQIARLARIRISDDEAGRLQSELTDILNWVEQLSAIDTENVAPMTRVSAIDQALRDDLVTDAGNAEAVVVNAPVSDSNFFVVPKVVE